MSLKINTSAKSTESTQSHERSGKTFKQKIVNCIKERPFSLLTMGLLSLAIPATWYLSRPDTIDPAVVKENIAKLGTVVAETTEGNLIGYAVDVAGGERRTIYATQDGKHLILGDAYDRVTGEPAFKPLVESMQARYGNPEDNSRGVAMPTGEGATVHPVDNHAGEGQAVHGEKVSFETPEIIKFLDTLPGFKENDKLASHQTVFVFYDPSCPYCHQLFKATRILKNKDVTIKWIPTLANGNKTDDIARKATLGLSANLSAEQFNSVFGEGTVNAEFNAQAVTALNDNLIALIRTADQAFGVNSDKQVPAVVYTDKNGTPRMMFGGSDEKDLKMIFGDEY